MGDLANPILGSLRSHRPGQLRADRDQGVHEVLGPHHVRELLHHQHHRAAQPPDRHDEPQLPAHLRQLGKHLIMNKQRLYLGLSQFLCLNRHYYYYVAFVYSHKCSQIAMRYTMSDIGFETLNK